jgi:CelD/BcsL family acetyltransferase involved in cellulose biosynthesis
MIETTAIRERQTLAQMRDEWAALHRDARPGSPFEHPAWAETWLQHFVPDGDLECVAVRDHALEGSLIGFAPLYRRHRLVRGLRATGIQPAGTGRGQASTEVVQVLALPDRTSEVLPAVVRHLGALKGWNWAQLSLGPQQGWLLPQWLDGDANAFITHRRTRPCVIIEDLPSDVESLRGVLKRNVRESIRRSHNRSARLGVTHRCLADAGDVEKSIPKLLDLHRMRSRMPGKVEHADMFGPVESVFLLEAATSLAQHGLARVHLAEHAGHPVAGLLVLSDGRTDYLSATGLDPRYWDLSLNTMLVFRALIDAIVQGRASVNLSTGPDIAKLRWTSNSTISTYQDFAIVRRDRWSRWLYGVIAHASMAAEHHQLVRLNRVLGGRRAERRHAQRARGPRENPTAIITGPADGALTAHPYECNST